MTSWEVGGADLARRPPERAPEAQARLWSRSAVAWGRYSGWWRGLGDENQRQRHVALKEAMMMAQMCENDLNRRTGGAAITVQRKLSPPEGDFDFERTISGGAPWFSRS